MRPVISTAPVDLLSRGAELREEAASYVLTTGSEEEKRLYLRTLVDETDIAISLHLGSAPTSTPAARLALTNIVQRKGRSIDAMTDQMAMLRRRLNDADRDVLNQFSEARARLASMVLRGVATDAQRLSVTALRSEIQRLEQAISTRSREFQIASRTATLGQIQEALPKGTALIEFVSYRPFFVRNARKTAFGAPRYAAYVLRGDGIAAGIDLGEAASIDRDVERFRTALSNPNRDARGPGRALHQALIAPISASLRAGERIIISPDGALNLIPFSALVGEDGTYLVEHATISYVGSGRDLIRVTVQAGSIARSGGADDRRESNVRAGADHVRVVHRSAASDAGSACDERARAEPPVRRPSRDCARSSSHCEGAARRSGVYRREGDGGVAEGVERSIDSPHCDAWVLSAAAFLVIGDRLQSSVDCDCARRCGRRS